MDSVDKIELIKETLERRGVSQTKLAELLGVNLTTVNNWFRRESIPAKYIDNISILFNLKIHNNSSMDKKENIDSNTATPITTVGTTPQIITLKHIDENKRITFNIDKTLIGGKELNSLRFNLYQSISKFVDIIDLSVENYCGDGLYYLKYPHGIILKKIAYNFSNSTYTVFDVNDLNTKIEIGDISKSLAGKVIVRMEVF